MTPLSGETSRETAVKETGKTEGGELCRQKVTMALLSEQLNLIFTTNYELELLFFHFVDVKSGIRRKKNV